MTNVDTQRLRDVADGSDKPHLQEPVLRFLLHEQTLLPSEAADVLESEFGYSVTRQMVHYGKQKHDLRDPVTAFRDVLRNDDADTEQGQPPSFLLSRSDETPVHPFDADCYKQNDQAGGESESDEMLSTTARLPSSVEHDSDSTTPEQPHSDSNFLTGYLKGCPWRVPRTNREVSLVSPPHESALNDLPDKYHACGCGDCPERHFLDGSNGAVDCPNPLPVTLSGVRRIYAKTEGSRVADGVNGNDVATAKTQYAKLMKADSSALSMNGNARDTHKFKRGKTTYDDITTVLVSLRLSPTDTHDRLVTPQRLIRDAKDGWAESRTELPTDTSNGLPTDTEHVAYYWTLAGTDRWATPHIHCYLWYADPDDKVTQEQFKPAVERFVKAATFPADCHLTDGGKLVDGTVRVEHEPLLANPERLSTRLDDGAFADVLDETTGPKRLTDGSDAQSRGAIYVGSQLPRFALAGAEPQASVEFASFIDATADGRHNNHGGGDFYQLIEILPHISEYEQVIPT